MRRAVFLDRDGTLLEEGNFVDRLDRLVFFPYSIDAVRALNRAGLRGGRRDQSIGRRTRSLY